MTVSAIAGHLRHLVSGDRDEWRHLPYRLAMKCRRIDLSWVSAEESGVSGRGEWHSNSGGPNLETVLNGLDISPSDAALDLGCGKGGALLTMARYPFRRVDGVELSCELAGIARTNIRKLCLRNASVFCCDAAEFTDLDIYSHLYMYNPFPEPVLKDVLANLEASRLRMARKLTIIYKNPVYENALLAAGFRKAAEYRHCTPHFCVFTN
jgi:SAM-dependent methyltransferase